MVVFGTSTKLRLLLKSIQNEGAQNRLTLIAGSEQWGESSDIISGFTSEAQGAITLRLGAAPNSNFTNALRSASLTYITSNVFLAQWFQEKLACSLDSNNRGQYARVCNDADRIVNFYPSYSTYVINSVYAVANAIVNITERLCTNRSTICAAYRSSNDVGKYIVEFIRDYNSGNDFRISNGEGMADLIFFNLRNGIYNQVCLMMCIF